MHACMRGRWWHAARAGWGRPAGAMGVSARFFQHFGSISGTKRTAHRSFTSSNGPASVGERCGEMCVYVWHHGATSKCMWRPTASSFGQPCGGLAYRTCPKAAGTRRGRASGWPPHVLGSGGSESVVCGDMCVHVAPHGDTHKPIGLSWMHVMGSREAGVRLLCNW